MTDPIVLSTDDLYPRTPEMRYRLYALRGDDLGVPLAAAPDVAGLGTAIQCFHEEARENGLPGLEGIVGILDTIEGVWVALPWRAGDPEPRGGRTIIGRERALVNQIAGRLNGTMQRAYEYTGLTETRRGAYFELRDPVDDYIVRVTVDFDRIDHAVS